MANTNYSQTVEGIIFNTPMVKLRKLVGENDANVFAKIESRNPGGSVKDRIAVGMINAAEKDGSLKPGGTIVEPTSGNTGIGLAMVGTTRGYNVVLCMPESMSVERRAILITLGAELVLTPAAQGMKGAIAKAEELAKDNGYFLPQQFKNPANPEIHRQTTGPEIIHDLEGLQIDACVFGVGTGGTLTGAGEVLKKAFPNMKIYAVEPTKSPVLSGGAPGPHKIQGIGAGFIPEILNKSLIDEVIQVDEMDAFNTAKNASKEEGLMIGISSGAACWAAIQVAKEMGEGKNVVTLFPDLWERYLSMESLFNQ